jgi:hypothetical protein
MIEVLRMGLPWLVEVLGRGDGKEEDKRGIDDEELPEAQGENESRGDGEEGDRQMGDRQEE